MHMFLSAHLQSPQQLRLTNPVHLVWILRTWFEKCGCVSGMSLDTHTV
jgi:hypothetical protein